MSQHRRPPQGPSEDVPSTPAGSKREQISAALKEGKIKIQLDARREGVLVPPDYAGDYSLALNLSWQFPKADMVVNEAGVAATLHFGGQPFRCEIPWGAIWGMFPPRATSLHVWPRDLPPELGGAARKESVKPPPVEQRKPRLQLVASSAEAESAETAPEAPPRPPWLKLVR